MNIYDVSKRYLFLFEAIENEESTQEEVQNALQALDSEFDIAADEFACHIKNRLAAAESIATEAKKLNDRATAEKTRADRLQNNLYNLMLKVGRDKVTTARNLLTIQKNPPSVVIGNRELFVEWAKSNNTDLLTFKEPEPNKTAIKKLLDSGELIDGVTVEQKERLVIK